jgi:glycosyltransferase involved in cell wall biosynthesis
MVTDHLGYAGGIIHGATRYYQQVLPRIDRRRIDMRLCILGGEHPFASTLERLDVRPVFLNRSKWDPWALWDLLQLMRASQTDVLHCLAMKGCLLGRLAGRLTGTPAIIHLHDTNRPGLVIGFLQRRLARWTARALAVSDVVRDYTIDTFSLPPGRVETLHNGLDLESFARPTAGARERAREDFGLPPDAPVIVVAGRVVRSKGQHALIGLMPRILRARPGAHLLVVGDGADLAQCRALAESLGLADHVRFTGQRADMADILAAADVACVPSLEQEGFGYTALEAAAAGKPVVAFAAGAMPQIVDDGVTGRVVARGDLAGMAAALIELTADDAVTARMGRAASSRARAFSIEHHVERLEALYGELAMARTAVWR